MDTLPLTPDFYTYDAAPGIERAEVERGFVHVYWQNGSSARFDVFLLRENSPDAETLHAQSREMLISPLDIPDDLQAIATDVLSNGALRVHWSTQESSDYHPGWLYENAWFEQGENTAALPILNQPITWDAATLPAPPSFDGQAVLDNDTETQLAWLDALDSYGIARLQGLPDEDGLLEKVVESIGPVRESNFGRQYVLTIKDDPDSNAYTSTALLQHMDMPTRECPHGLQFLFCRANTTQGGQGVYVDGLRIAQALQKHEPAAFKALTGVKWVFNNRAKNSDYRAQGPVIETDAKGNPCVCRVTAWLRSPLKAPAEIQQQAYQAFRVFTRYAQDPKYQLLIEYKAGDLVAFDNRRLLHGRLAYNAKGGQRFIEGMYSDRDDLYSRIRVLRRQLKAVQ